MPEVRRTPPFGRQEEGRAGLMEASDTYPDGRVNDGVIAVPPFTTKLGVVPNADEPLRSNMTLPEDPEITDAAFGVNVAQFAVIAADVEGMAGNVCVNSVVGHSSSRPGEGILVVSIFLGSSWL